MIQSLKYETDDLGVFLEFLWHKNLFFARIVPKSLPDPQNLRNQKSINPILTIWNVKEAYWNIFVSFLRENAKNKAEI